MNVEVSAEDEKEQERTRYTEGISLSKIIGIVDKRQAAATIHIHGSVSSLCK